ncbi:transcription factor SPT20 homolog [Watersipora subatra]|uniref:transcription factor SPT20 homolog n=1 Tax=Watersipora subatra TaxID=2589382 RepID=UPI00355C200C
MAHTVCTNPNILFNSTISSEKGSLKEKLLHLYLQQFSQQSQARACPNLLSKLVAREELNTLVIHLKSIDEGYSICLNLAGSGLVETSDVPYTDWELLKFIEQEELPHTLVDLFEHAQPDLFYDGCVVAEIRDSRRAVKGAYKTSYILLKPSQRSLLTDINSLTNDQFRWSQDDRLALESQLLLATSEPLCLTPTPAVTLVRNRLIFKKKVALTEEIRRAMRPYSTKAILRKKSLLSVSCHRYLPVLAFLEQRGEKSKYSHSRSPHIKPQVVDSWKRAPIELSPVFDTDVAVLAKACVSKAPSSDCTPIVVDEYAIETERPMGRLNRSHLVILKKPSDENFLGELRIDHIEGDTSRCSFELGTEPLKEKYIEQLIEIFSEEGRRQVKITRTQPGLQPTVIYTSGPSHQGSITPKSSSSQIRFSTSMPTSSQTSFRSSNDCQQANQISQDTQLTEPVSLITLEKQPTIKFSLTSQPGSYSLAKAEESMSSNQSGSASLLQMGRQGLKIPGGLLSSNQSSHSEPITNPNERSAIKEPSAVSAHFLKSPPVTSSAKQLADSFGKTTFIMSKGATGLPVGKSPVAGSIAQLTAKSATRSPVVQLSVGSQAAKHIGLSTSTNSGTPVSLQNITGLQTVHGLHNVQVSLTSLAQGGIAVPVTLLSSMSGSQPIFLPLNVMESSTNQQVLNRFSLLGQSSCSTGVRPIVITTQAGANQQIIGGHQGLITLPVGSSLAQQLLAVNKRPQAVNTQLPSQQASSQMLTNQQGTPQTSHIPSNQKQSSVQIGQLLGSQQMPIQIGHTPANQQSSSMHVPHQIITQNSGSLQMRPVPTTRSSSLQVFQQPTVVSAPQVNSSQISIVSTQTASSSTPQVLQIPQNLAFAQLGSQARLAAPGQARASSGQQQVHFTSPSQQARLPLSVQTRFSGSSQASQKVLFRQLGSPEEFQSPPPDAR